MTTHERTHGTRSSALFWLGIAMIWAGIALAMFYAGLVVGSSVDAALPPWTTAALLLPAIALGLAGGWLQRRNS